jgi:hypothetical protein
VKIDSYALESNVHFPTDVNLLWDAARKCLDIIGQLTSGEPQSGWRKHKAWSRRICRDYQAVSRVMSRGGRNREVLLEESTLRYLRSTRELSFKIEETRAELIRIASETTIGKLKYNELLHYERLLDKHISLVRRRIIFKEEIPHEEKLFSLFEPYTRWINKGKAGGKVELGLPVAVCSDQHGFILHHHVMVKEMDVDIAVPLAEAVLKWGNIHSLSYDRGFWSPGNYQALHHRVKELIMPKKGKLSKEEAEREGSKAFLELRRQHSAVESDINALEHHGLNRCPDRGLDHFRKYVALGVLSLNLHRLGNLLLAEDRKEAARERKKRKAA